MGISKRHLSTHKEPVQFDAKELGNALRDGCPQLLFVLLMGSAKDGRVEVGSDIDLALYTEGKPDLALLTTVQDTVARFAPGVHCDMGLLNRSEPVFRFEALKGRLLFTRDREAYASFFSLTCREYESQCFDYERQHRYRVESA